jgi:tetratricopeptide (TPR) repeat protein
VGIPAKSELDNLFLAYASQIVKPERTLELLAENPDLQASAIGIHLRGIAQLSGMANGQDASQLESAISDLKLAQTLFARNGNYAAYSKSWLLLAYTQLVQLNKASDNKLASADILPLAESLAEEISQTDNAAHLYSAVLFFQATDRPVEAKEAMAKALLHDNTFCFYFAAGCLQTTSDPKAAIEEFERRIGAENLNQKYVRLARAILYAKGGRTYQEIKSMISDCLSDPSPLIRKWELIPLKLTKHNESEFMKDASAACSDFRYEGSETDYERGDVLMLNFLSGQFDRSVVLERTSGRSLPDSVASFVIGVDYLSAGRIGKSRSYFQRSIEANHVTFDAAWARALLVHLPSDN